MERSLPRVAALDGIAMKVVRQVANDTAARIVRKPLLTYRKTMTRMMGGRIPALVLSAQEEPGRNRLGQARVGNTSMLHRPRRQLYICSKPDISPETSLDLEDGHSAPSWGGDVGRPGTGIYGQRRRAASNLITGHQY
jgi:hypothetical protein